MKKKLITLIAGLSLVSASSFAGELTSLTSEAVLNDFDGGLEQVEWTLGKGSYKIDDTYKFTFDVDKDYITDNSGAINPDNLGAKYQGWDTQFGIVQKMDKVGTWDLSLNYLLRYDDQWAVNTNDKELDNQVDYIVSPYFSKDIKIAGKDYSAGVELWAQVGGEKGKSLQNDNGFEVNGYLEGALTDKWYLSLAGYNWYYFDGTEDEYDYTLGTEDSLTYTLPLKGGLSFVLDSKLEAYYMPDRAKNVKNYTKIEAYVKPQLRFTKKVDDHLSWHAAVAYEAVSLLAKDSDSQTPTKVWDDNEMEITLGFIVK